MVQDQNDKQSAVRNRWIQLVVGIVGMVAIANLQYGWTLFVGPIDSQFHWGKAAIQVAFTLFVLAETWLVPLEAYFVDRYGPRVIPVGKEALPEATPVRSVRSRRLEPLRHGQVPRADAVRHVARRGCTAAMTGATR